MDYDAPPSEVRIGTLPADRISGAVQALEYAKTIAITDQSTYELAAQEARQLAARRDAIEAERVAIKAPLLEATRKLDALFKRATDPLDSAIDVVKGTMLGYRRKLEEQAAAERRAQEEAARKARLEAERKAAEERAKAEAEARRKREEAARAQAEADEAARRAREATNAREKEAAERARKEAEEAQRKAQSQADAATARGEQRASSALQKAAEVAARPLATAEVPTAKGTATRMKRTAVVRDLQKLQEAVAAGKAPWSAFALDQKALDRAAASMGPELPKFYPGVELVETPILAVGSK